MKSRLIDGRPARPGASAQRALSEVRFGHEQSSALHWMHRHCAWDHCTTRETPRCSESSSTTLILSCSNGQLSCSAQCVWQLVRTEQCVALSGEYREELLEAQRLAARKRQQLGPEAQPATAFVALHRLKQAVQVTYPQQSHGRRSEAGTVNACMLELTAAFRPSELNPPPPHLSRACSHHERRSSKSWSNL